MCNREIRFFLETPCTIDEQNIFRRVKLKRWLCHANQTKLKVKTRYLHKKIARLTTFLLLFEHTKSTMYAVSHMGKSALLCARRGFQLSAKRTKKQIQHPLSKPASRARAAASLGRRARTSVQSSAAVGVQNVIKYHHLRGQ